MEPIAVQKSPDAFRTISEVSSELDVPQHVLRFWESKFSQIRPLKRAGGRRYYRPDDVDLLRGIRTLLYGDGFTIKGVQKLFREQGARHIAQLGKVASGRSETGEPRPANASAAALRVVARAEPIVPAEAHRLPITPEQRTRLEAVLQELLTLRAMLDRAGPRR